MKSKSFWWFIVFQKRMTKSTDEIDLSIFPMISSIKGYNIIMFDEPF